VRCRSGRILWQRLTPSRPQATMMPSIELENHQKLRELDTWYRDYAGAGTPWGWEMRLQTAEEIERRAAMLEDSRRLTEAERGSRTRDAPCPRTASVGYSVDPLIHRRCM